MDIERPATMETLQNGRFVIVGTIGEGANAKTFDGVDKREGRPVAIKRFDVRGAKGWKDVELAEREARVLSALSHPKIPRYVDHFEHDGALYLVMEKVEGESLSSLRARGIAFGEAEVLRLLGDASSVLEYLHGRSPPVVHRDLKPGNVLRRPDGSFAFVDFGSVRDKLRPEGGSTVVGTFGYMAPEQFQGRALPASDVYAIGATALSMLTGREPEDLPHRGLAIDVQASLAGRGSERVRRMLERMLDPDPDRRAARIAPLLEGMVRSRRTESQPPEALYSRRDRRRARKLEKEARRREAARRKAERRSRRRAYGGPHRPPLPLALFFRIGLLVAIVAVSLATQVVVPTILRLLSVLLARRALWEAANAVRDAGSTAIDGMARSSSWMRGPAGSPAPPVPEQPDEASTRTRVARSDDPGIRIADDDREEAEDSWTGENRKRGRPEG
jgi:serine/threonine protein kinase